MMRVRFYSNPPRKSFISNKNHITLWWYNKVPINVKYCGGIIGVATSIANIHPNILITAGPPIVIGSYFIYKSLLEKIYQSEVKILQEGKVDVKFPKYDETSIDNVLNGIENEFDYFKSKIITQITSTINSNLSGELRKVFVTGDQISYKLGDIENFIVLNFKGEKFIKFGIPFLRQKRLGVIEVYLRQPTPDITDTEPNVDEYKMRLVITPLGSKSYYI